MPMTHGKVLGIMKFKIDSNNFKQSIQNSHNTVTDYLKREIKNMVTTISIMVRLCRLCFRMV